MNSMENYGKKLSLIKKNFPKKKRAKNYSKGLCYTNSEQGKIDWMAGKIMLWELLRIEICATFNRVCQRFVLMSSPNASWYDKLWGIKATQIQFAWQDMAWVSLMFITQNSKKKKIIL